MADDLIVFSHLRWDFVFQRPQHLMSRLASHRRVFFFEEPIHSPHAAAHLRQYEPCPRVVVCQPHTPERGDGFHDQQLPYLQDMLAKMMAQHQIRDWSAWFYTPMALPLISQSQPRTVIYDCMDELAAFLHAPKQLLQREAALFKVADLVFTGGPSLYEAKRSRHASVYHFPSSVDAVHFAQARNMTDEPPVQADLPQPRLGFFGVIDERFDSELLDFLALSRPQWQFIMVGPVVKIDPATLPRHANIHYLGQQRYEDLPRFLAGWHVSLLPFARNESTRYISPTKTLEYLAADRPVVSTAINDVEKLYGDVVFLAKTHEEFLLACEHALMMDAGERTRMREDTQQLLASVSWDQTAASIHRLIEEKTAQKLTLATSAMKVSGALQATDSIASQVQTYKKRRPTRRSDAPVTPVLVVGAGPTGLCAAYQLGNQALLIEQNEQVGGWCRSVHENGFTFDHAGHIMFSNDPYVHALYEKLLGDNVHWQDREAWIYSKQVYTRYPFQGSLFGLPPDVIKECIVGAIEARFGPLNGPSAPPAPRPVGAQSTTEEKALEDCCGDGIMESTAPLHRHALRFRNRRKTPRNFEDFIYDVWGAGIAKHFAIPYNKKLWAVPLREMETSWLGGRVPLPNLEDMIESALQPSIKPMGPNARFGYPLKGGFQALMNGFLPLLKGPLLLGKKMISLSLNDKRLRLNDGTEHAYDTLISTIPLPKLIHSIDASEVPDDIRSAANALRSVSVRCVNLGIGRENLTDKHWIYYPEDTVFHRIFVQGNASPHCNPPGGFGLTCEISYSEYKPLPVHGDDLIRRCIEDCIRVGMLRPDDPIWVANQVDIPDAYVVYDHQREQCVETLRNWLLGYDILLAGRYSEWQYYNSDHAFLAGRNAAEKALKILQSHDTLMVNLE